MKMKKRVAVMFLACFAFAGTKAQKQNLALGPTAGFGHAWLSNTSNSKYKPAGNVGLALVYSASPHLGFGADLKFSIEGNKTETGIRVAENTLDYIRVPLKLIYFFGDYGDRLRPKIAAGPSFGFLIGGNREIRDNGMQISKTDANDLYNSFDAGLGALVGLNYRLVKNTWFTADINYYNGFTGINKVGNVDMKNRNIGLNIGVNFGIGTAKP